jgi:flavin-dependent dehydrogenase
MIETEIIIVGAGPAGSTCARRLQDSGRELLILDKQAFPRLKLCAGWITPQVVNDLRVDLAGYPHSLVTFNTINFHFRGLTIPLPTRQYAIRRIEFDHWLLTQAGVTTIQHTVRHIRQENGRYILDDKFRCQVLVGAGGTNCPVYHALFKTANPRAQQQQIVCLEEEFTFPVRDENCHLWFFDRGLVGYSWYVPKGNTVVNVGIGGKLASLKARGQSIHDHWQHFTAQLASQGLVNGYPFQPKGYQYFLRDNVDRVQLGQAYLVGDAAGLATKDMGEGIGPAVASGILAAASINNGRPYTVESISRYSLPSLLWARRLI